MRIAVLATVPVSGALFTYAVRKVEKFSRDQETLEFEDCLLFGRGVSVTFTRTLWTGVAPETSVTGKRKLPSLETWKTRAGRGYRLVAMHCEGSNHLATDADLEASLTVDAAVANSCEALLEDSRREESLAHKKLLAKCPPVFHGRKDPRKALALRVFEQHWAQFDQVASQAALEVIARDPVCTGRVGGFSVSIGVPQRGSRAVEKGKLTCEFRDSRVFFWDSLLLASALETTDTCQEATGRLDLQLMCLTATDALTETHTFPRRREEDEDAEVCEISSGDWDYIWFSRDVGRRNMWKILRIGSHPQYTIDFEDGMEVPSLYQPEVDTTRVVEKAQRLLDLLNTYAEELKDMTGFSPPISRLRFAGEAWTSSDTKVAPECLMLRAQEFSKFSFLNAFALRD